MASNQVTVKLQIKHGLATSWTESNPVLAEGEYGLETNTHLLKIGDGVHTWTQLPYLNKLDDRYFTQDTDGTITFSAAFMEIVNNIGQHDTGTYEQLTITNQPINPTDAANKRYVDEAIASAGHLKRKKVNQLPSPADADEDTIYMILNANGQAYDEYLFIDGGFDSLGSTTAAAYELPIATSSTLGGVKSSTADDYVQVTQTGFMTLNRVSTSLLYVPDGDELVIYGGTA